MKQLVGTHQESKHEQDEIKKRQEIAAQKLRKNAAVRQKLEAIKNKYMALISSIDPQGRGFELERIMYDLLNFST